MRIDHPWIMKLGGLGIAVASRAWMGTLRYKAVYYERQIDPVMPEFRGPAAFLFWHEYIPFLFYLRGHCNIAMLLSRHQDAEWLSQAARHMGFETVRGSTNRGGVAAMRALLSKGRRMNLAITPDGPRGPRRRLAPGCIYLSSRLGLPLIPIGLGYDHPWRSRRAWDQFAVPRPFTNARAVAGPAVRIPADVDREGVEHYRRRLERLLNQLTTDAEQWASSGRPIDGQTCVWREAAFNRGCNGYRTADGADEHGYGTADGTDERR